MKKIMVLLFAAISVTLSGQINAALLFLSSSDPIMDQFGAAPDLTGMTFAFDNDSGNYTIGLHTTSSNPFVGDFRININLFNLDVGTSERDPSFFNDTFNDFSLLTPTTTLTLMGVNTRLQEWEAGDRILLNNIPDAIPHPDGVSTFRSGVFGLPLITAFTNEDMLGIEKQIDVLSAVTAPPSAVPVPPTLWLFGSCLIGLIGIARRKKGIVN